MAKKGGKHGRSSGREFEKRSGEQARIVHDFKRRIVGLDLRIFQKRFFSQENDWEEGKPKAREGQDQ